MIRRLTILFLTVSVLFVGSALILRHFRGPTTPPVSVDTTEPPVNQFEIVSDNQTEESRVLTREVLLSSPLVIFDRGSVTPFKPSAVVTETNRERINIGLPALAPNILLDKAAEAKVRDLFEKQYFEHISPSGQGPDALAKQVGYEYVSIGENLALGTFGDEGALVAAWMNSPGHRANILRPQFQEIGIAIGRGTYEGRQVLIAVQEFGRPVSSCPAVSGKLKSDIDTQKTTLASASKALDSLRKEVDTMTADTARDQAAYESKIDLYNARVTAYNKLAAAIKEKTNTYNGQVRKFNDCLKAAL